MIDSYSGVERAAAVLRAGAHGGLKAALAVNCSQVPVAGSAA